MATLRGVFLIQDSVIQVSTSLLLLHCILTNYLVMYIMYKSFHSDYNIA